MKVAANGSDVFRSTFIQSRFILAPALFFACFTVLYGQAFAPSRLDPKLVAYTDHLLLRLGNLEEPAAALERREAAYSRIFSLSPSERIALHTAAQNFHDGLVPIRTAKISLLSGKARSGNSHFSDSDRAQVQNLVNKRTAMVRNLTAQLLNSISPEAAARLFFAANGGPKPSR